MPDAEALAGRSSESPRLKGPRARNASSPYTGCRSRRRKCHGRPEDTLKTEIYEVDPFTSRKDKLITTIESDYRFERQDEIFISGAAPMRVRVINVMVRLVGGKMERELLVMKL